MLIRGFAAGFAPPPGFAGGPRKYTGVMQSIQGADMNTAQGFQPPPGFQPPGGGRGFPPQGFPGR